MLRLGGPALCAAAARRWLGIAQRQVSTCLGESPEADFEQFGHELQPGEALVVVATGTGDPASCCPISEAALAEALQGKLDLSAAELVAAAQEAISRGERRARRQNNQPLARDCLDGPNTRAAFFAISGQQCRNPRQLRPHGAGGQTHDRLTVGKWSVH